MKNKPKPFMIRNGEAYCRGCEQWKPLSGFYDDRSAKASYHGKRIRCKTCECADRSRYYQRNKDAQRKLIRERKRLASKLNRQADRAAIKREQSKRTLVEMSDSMYDVLVEHLEMLIVRHEEIQNVVFLCSTSERQLWSVLNRKYKSLELNTVERILLAADAQMDIELFMPEPGLDGWSSKGHRYCQDCGTWDHPHCARGLCSRCYTFQLRNDGRLRSESGDMRKGVRKYWARTVRLDACKMCHRSDVRHHSGGWCEVCWQRANKRRLRMGIPVEVANFEKIAALPFRTDVTKLNIIEFMK